MRRIAKACVQLLTLLLTVAVAVAVGVVVLVAQGPVSLAPLNPYLEAALAGALGSYNVGIEDTILSWDGEADRIDLRAVNVRLSDDDGRDILSVPQMSVTLSAVEVLRWRAVVTKASLIRPRLSLLRDSEGGLFLLQPESGNRWPLAMRSDGADENTISFGRLRTVAVVDAHVTLTDEASGASVLAPSVTAELGVEDDRLVGRATTRIRFAGSEAAVGIGFGYAGADEGLQTVVNFAELDLAALGRLLVKTPLAELSRLHLTLSGTLEVMARADGSDPAVSFDVKAGPGSIDLPELWAEALAVSGITVKGRADIDAATAEIDEAVASLPAGPSFTIAGTATRAEHGVDVRGNLAATPFATALLRQYWPEDFADGARNWVLTNIKAGTIANMKVAFDLPSAAIASGNIADDAVRLNWDFDGVVSTYLDDLPPLRNGRGRGQVTVRRFDLVVDGAEVEGGLSVSDGRLAVADLAADRPVMAIDFVTRGPARGVLALLNRPPLGLPARIGLSPDSVSGQSATATRLTVPMLESVSLDDIGYSAAATLTNVSMPGVWQSWDLHKGELTLKADDGSLRLNGTAQVNGIPLSLEWRRPIDSAAPVSSLQVQGMARVDQLEGLGFDATPYAMGDLGLRLQLDLMGDDIGGQIELDLTPTELSLPALAWSKPAGQTAGARFKLELAGDGRVALRGLNVAAPALELQGGLLFDAAGALQEMQAQRLVLNGSHLVLDIRRADPDTYDAMVSGDRLDLRPFDFKLEALSGDAADWPAAVRLNARLRQVVVTDTLVLTNVDGAALRDRSRWRNADVTALLAEQARARLVLQATDYGYRLNLASNDAGTAARAFGIYDHAAGGRMYLKARIATGEGEDADVAGVLRADDFVLNDAPLLAQMLTLGSLRGINDAISGKGIAFTRLELPFVMRGDIIEVKDGRALGPALGLTGELAVDRGSDSIRANGTLIPAYTINSVLGNIPLIGNILVGRKDEGVFALTFQIDGTTEAPRITVNPLSALAPGFLRRILEGLEQPAEVLDQDAKLLQRETIERRQ